ncbi:FAGR306Cp [Eremothecium gossypii FDAG1]|nr:FAGR306Cp [Eremothecium gossypii FDAG1]
MNAAKEPEVPFDVIAKYTYESIHDGDLNFEDGQRIEVISIEDNQWYYGHFVDGAGNEQEGIFPKNYVEVAQDDIHSAPTGGIGMHAGHFPSLDPAAQMPYAVEARREERREAPELVKLHAGPVFTPETTPVTARDSKLARGSAVIGEESSAGVVEPPQFSFKERLALLQEHQRRESELLKRIHAERTQEDADTLHEGAARRSSFLDLDYAYPSGADETDTQRVAEKEAEEEDEEEDNAGLKLSEESRRAAIRNRMAVLSTAGRFGVAGAFNPFSVAVAAGLEAEPQPRAAEARKEEPVAAPIPVLPGATGASLNFRRSSETTAYSTQADQPLEDSGSELGVGDKSDDISLNLNPMSIDTPGNLADEESEAYFDKEADIGSGFKSADTVTTGPETSEAIIASLASKIVMPRLTSEDPSEDYQLHAKLVAEVPSLAGIGRDSTTSDRVSPTRNERDISSPVSPSGRAFKGSLDSARSSKDFGASSKVAPSLANFATIAPTPAPKVSHTSSTSASPTRRKSPSPVSEATAKKAAPPPPPSTVGAHTDLEAPTMAPPPPPIGHLEDVKEPSVSFGKSSKSYKSRSLREFAGRSMREQHASVRETTRSVVDRPKSTALEPAKVSLQPARTLEPKRTPNAISKFAPPPPPPTNTTVTMPTSSTQIGAVLDLSTKDSVDDGLIGDAHEPTIKFERDDTWWLEKTVPKSLVNSRGKFIWEVDEKLIEKRHGARMVCRDFYFLFEDYSQLHSCVVYNEQDSIHTVKYWEEVIPFDPEEALAVESTDMNSQLFAKAYDMLGKTTKKFIPTLFSELPSLIPPIESCTYGVTVLTYDAGGTLDSEAMKSVKLGDLLVIMSGHFVTHARLLHRSKFEVTPDKPRVSIISEYDYNKKKIRVIEDHNGKVRQGSYKLSEFVKGQMKICRAVTRNVVGW